MLPRPAWWARPSWRLLMLVAIVARWLSFGNPVIQVDEEFYYATAHAMWHGALPFVDVWDRKPIGLFLVYMPAAWLPFGWGVTAYQVLALASLVATARLIAAMAARVGWQAGALAAAIAYLLWPDLLNGVGGQAPIFYNLPMAAAGALIVLAERSSRPRRLGIAAMALVGIALQIKYSAVFEGVFFGLWLLWRDSRKRSLASTAGYGVALVAVALAPTLLALIVYVALGHGDAFVFANFGWLGHRNGDPWPGMLGNLGTLVLILSPLVAMALAGSGEADAGQAVERRFLRFWLVAALVGVAVFGTWFDHYGLPVLVPGAAGAAGFLGRPRVRRAFGPAILLIVAIGGQVTVAINRHNRGNAAQFDALATLVGRGLGGLYVYSGTTMLYPATGRPALSRYLVPAHLNRVREDGASGVDQAVEVRRIMAAGPAVVVMRPPFRGERPDIRATVLAMLLREGYRRVAVTPMGQEAISIYQR
ncbi:MAG: DUF2029 domain-containing protein [Sphingomonas sp.]|nr:DUF2029 domain-containing protein [Sphingomonas sp.]